MSVKHQVYSDNKDSGFTGLGKVPVNWKLSKFKYEVSFQEGPGILAKDFFDEGVPLIRIQNVKGDTVSADFKTYLAPETVRQKWDHFRVELGDLLISGSASTDLVSEVTEESEGAIPYTGIIRLKPLKGRTYKNYLRYFVKSELFSNQIGLLKTGSTIQHFGPEHLRQVFMLSPGFYEQEAIANFLDHETAKIDTLIDKQQQLIKLLKEKRQAVISHAVTKGLNPDAPMKDSGVEWLGEVPEHWVVARIKNIVAIPVTDGPHETPEFLDEGVPFVSAEAVSGGFVNFYKIRGYISEIADAIYSKKYSPKLHDIYMVKSGATTGVTAIVETNDKFNIWSPLAVIRCKPNISPYFTLNFMRSFPFQEAVELNWSFGTQQNIGMGVIENLHITCPPLDEAIAIAEHLQRENQEYQALIEKCEKAILLMQERRTALISAAVTGKIDVRNWQPAQTKISMEASA